MTGPDPKREREAEVEDLELDQREAEDVKGGGVTLQEFTITKTVDKSTVSLSPNA